MAHAHSDCREQPISQATVPLCVRCVTITPALYNCVANKVATTQFFESYSTCTSTPSTVVNAICPLRSGVAVLHVIRNWLTNPRGDKSLPTGTVAGRARGEVLALNALLLSSLTNTRMSSPPQTLVSSSQFKAILDAALSEYKTKTGNDLTDNPLGKELQSCESSEAVLDIIQRQAKAFDKFRDSNKWLMKWIGPSVDVLFTISSTLSAGVSIVRDTIRDDLRVAL